MSGFFKIKEPWEDEWQDMPEYICENKNSFKDIIVHFKTEQDLKDFAKLINQRITSKTKYIWFPKAEIETMMDKRYTDEP